VEAEFEAWRDTLEDVWPDRLACYLAGRTAADAPLRELIESYRAEAKLVRGLGIETRLSEAVAYDIVVEELEALVMPAPSEEKP
jgi:hypothetical protein